MSELLTDLQEIVKERWRDADEDSYTYYLFREGLDKILKKVGEETAETIIAAKNLDSLLVSPGGRPGLGVTVATKELLSEIGDLLYHLTVMCAKMGVDIDEVDGLLRGRMARKGNLKETTRSDMNT
jgi:phosphoribosyl-ATP pyrophosphohydrolase